jgi:hypothetical protein
MGNVISRSSGIFPRRTMAVISPSPGTWQPRQRYRGQREIMMAHPSEHDQMTDEQRDTIKRLCHEADIPDKSGEILSPDGADALIAELQDKAEQRAKA